jgi:hypothetical protein
MNQLKRAEMQSRRAADADVSGAYAGSFPAASSWDHGLDGRDSPRGQPQLLGHRRLPHPDTMPPRSQWPDAMAALQESHAATLPPPPSYRRPPEHVFAENL